MAETLKRNQGAGADPLAAMGLGLAKKLSAMGQPAQSGMLAHALHELLDGQDEASKALRLIMQIHLARVSNESVAAPAQAEAVEMLSTEEAALLMDCSRPHVAMLIDAGKLAGGVKSKGGVTGDQLVTVKIVLPPNIDDSLSYFFSEWRQKHAYDPGRK